MHHGSISNSSRENPGKKARKGWRRTEREKEGREEKGKEEKRRGEERREEKRREENRWGTDNYCFFYCNCSLVLLLSAADGTASSPLLVLCLSTVPRCFHAKRTSIGTVDVHVISRGWFLLAVFCWSIRCLASAAVHLRNSPRSRRPSQRRPTGNAPVIGSDRLHLWQPLPIGESAVWADV